MSYDAYLIDPQTNKVIVLDEKHKMIGGSYQIGGTNEAWLNITYNYGPHFIAVFGEGGIRSLNGKTCVESIPILNDAIRKLKSDTDPNYWIATEGNAQLALVQLLCLAAIVQCKTAHAVWSIS